MRVDRVYALIVIPAKAGIQSGDGALLDPRLRGDDKWKRGDDGLGGSS